MSIKRIDSFLCIFKAYFTKIDLSCFLPVQKKIFEPKKLFSELRGVFGYYS